MWRPTLIVPWITLAIAGWAFGEIFASVVTVCYWYALR